MQDPHSTSQPLSELDKLRLENAALSSKLITAEQKLLSLEKVLKQTLHINQILEQHSLVIITDNKGIMSYVNDGFCVLSKYTKQELVGKNANIVNAGYHSSAFFSQLWQTIASGQTWQGEIRNKAKDGSYFWVDMVITPLLDEMGEIKQYVAVRKDTSLSKQAEAQMRFDAHILSHINDAVVGLDSAYQVNFWNQGAQRQYGLAAQQVMGKPLSEAYESIWIKPEDESKAMQHLLRTGYCQVEIIHKLKNGKQLYVEATTQILLNELGEKAGLLALIRDVTRRKEGEKALSKVLEELERKNYELDNYVYKVSHDLRAPLTSMQGLLNLIKLESNQALKDQYLTLIESRVTKLDDYIQSILHHSKMVNAAIEITVIDFEKIIEECFEELKHFANWHKVRLAVHVKGNSHFYSDAFRITVILKNIITNAIKYFNAQTGQSYLHFDIDITPSMALISIEDNGIGIDELYVDKIFNMFFRATASSQGSGLGLYIVKQAIDKLSGTIKVESQKGKGTVFVIQLPNLIN